MTKKTEGERGRGREGGGREGGRKRGREEGEVDRGIRRDEGRDRVTKKTEEKRVNFT